MKRFNCKKMFAMVGHLVLSAMLLVGITKPNSASAVNKTTSDFGLGTITFDVGDFDAKKEANFIGDSAEIVVPKPIYVSGGGPDWESADLAFTLTLTSGLKRFRVIEDGNQFIAIVPKNEVTFTWTIKNNSLKGPGAIGPGSTKTMTYKVSFSRPTYTAGSSNSYYVDIAERSLCFDNNNPDNAQIRVKNPSKTGCTTHLLTLKDQNDNNVSFSPVGTDFTLLSIPKGVSELTFEWEVSGAVSETFSYSMSVKDITPEVTLSDGMGMICGKQPIEMSRPNLNEVDGFSYGYKLSGAMPGTSNVEIKEVGGKYSIITDAGRVTYTWNITAQSNLEKCSKTTSFDVVYTDLMPKFDVADRQDYVCDGSSIVSIDHPNIQNQLGGYSYDYILSGKYADGTGVNVSGLSADIDFAKLGLVQYELSVKATNGVEECSATKNFNVTYNTGTRPSFANPNNNLSVWECSNSSYVLPDDYLHVNGAGDYIYTVVDATYTDGTQATDALRQAREANLNNNGTRLGGFVGVSRVNAFELHEMGFAGNIQYHTSNQINDTELNEPSAIAVRNGNSVIYKLGVRSRDGGCFAYKTITVINRPKPWAGYLAIQSHINDEYLGEGTFCMGSSGGARLRLKGDGTGPSVPVSMDRPTDNIGVLAQMESNWYAIRVEDYKANVESLGYGFDPYESEENKFLHKAVCYLRDRQNGDSEIFPTEVMRSLYSNPDDLAGSYYFIP